MLLSGITPIKNFDYFADLGYDAVDVSFCATIYTKEKHGHDHDAILDDEDWKKNLDVYKEKCVKRNMKINSTHIPYRYDYSDYDAPDYEYNYKMTCRALEASEYLGAKWTVVHVHADGVQKTVAHIKKLFADTGVKNIGIAIENMINKPIEPVIEACDTLKAEGYNVGICLDTGHCNINDCIENDITDVIHRMGSRIKVLHIHDNCKNGDFHREPYAGNIPWDNVMNALKDVNFDGDFNYELNFRRIPEQIRPVYDKYCVELAKYLISIFEEE